MRSIRSSLLPLLAFILLFAGIAPPFSAQQTGTEDRKTEKQVKITEEIQVVGKAPREQPIATVTKLDFTLIERNKPLDLSEAIRYAPGVNVTYGNKYEFTLKLRGMDSRRIALLIDGVPSYEPYYGSFDLKTVSAAGLDLLQITKGRPRSSTARTPWPGSSTSSPAGLRESRSSP
jgi:outer membrane cobalamin receptor